MQLNQFQSFNLILSDFKLHSLSAVNSEEFYTDPVLPDIHFDNDHIKKMMRLIEW